MTAKSVKELLDGDALEIGKLYRASTAAYLEAGKRLLAKKESLRHGEWLPWLEANKAALGFGDNTANRLMKFARENPELTQDLPFLDDADRRELNRELWGNAPRAVQQMEYCERDPDPDPDQSQEWYTDAAIIELARKVLGQIDLDPASCEKAQETVKARKYYCEKKNGLKLPWKGRVWLNPPFVFLDAFISKLVSHIQDGSISAAIVLTPNATDTDWFHQLSDYASRTCFPSGRLKFTLPDGTTQTGKRGNAISYIGPNPDRFKSVFSDIGYVVRKA
jgi:hypothetical protein